MKSVLTGVAIGLGALAVGLGAQAAPAEPDPAALAYRLPDQIPWQRESRMGSLVHVLWGDPTKPGPYAMLVKWEPHHFSQPHTHPNARYITVLSGTWWVGT